MGLTQVMSRPCLGYDSRGFMHCTTEGDVERQAVRCDWMLSHSAEQDRMLIIHEPQWKEHQALGALLLISG